MTLPDGLPMHDVVKMVIQAEAEAKGILQDAEAQAEGLAADARRRAQEIVKAIRREAAEQTDAMLQAAEQDAQRERQDRLTRASAQIETAVHLDPPTVRALVEAVLCHVHGAS